MKNPPSVCSNKRNPKNSITWNTNPKHHTETNLKENEKGRPSRTYANALVQGPIRGSISQENKLKTGEINLKMLLVIIHAQTIYQNWEKKSNFEPQQGKTNTAKSPTRSHSKTNYTQNEQAKEIEELKKEIAQFK